MSTIVGEVVGVDKKQGTSRAGKPFTIHYVKLDSFDDPINVGFKQTYNLGDKFNDNIEIKYGEYQKTTAPASVDATPSANGKDAGSVPMKAIGRPGAAPYPVPADHPENRIMRQNALAHATKIITARLGNESYTAKQTKDNGFLAKEVIAIAHELVTWSTGRYEVEALEELASIGVLDDKEAS